MVFIEDKFIGGHDNFVKIFLKENKNKNKLTVVSNDIKKEEKELLRLLDGLSKRNRSRKTA